MPANTNDSDGAPATETQVQQVLPTNPPDPARARLLDDGMQPQHTLRVKTLSTLTEDASFPDHELISEPAFGVRNGSTKTATPASGSTTAAPMTTKTPFHKA